jgi:tRNA/tmRNA/rRNA uracil-C5-methylase (TrmA/RlmC/RlmD family)
MQRLVGALAGAGEGGAVLTGEGGAVLTGIVLVKDGEKKTGTGAASNSTSRQEKELAGRQEKELEVLWGAAHLFEELLGARFRVSPEAFFQVNSEGCCILYECIYDCTTHPWRDSTAARDAEGSTARDAEGSTAANADGGRDEEVTLVDVCCGTGSIGICVAHMCKQSEGSGREEGVKGSGREEAGPTKLRCEDIIGVETNAAAVTDACFNARLNALEGRTRYVCSTAHVVSSSLQVYNLML